MTGDARNPKPAWSILQNRRRFLQALGVSAAVGAAPAILRAANQKRVVVVGGGFAGATVAKYIRRWSDQGIEVTLVERKRNHVSCILSNLVLNDSLRLGEIRLSYKALRQQHGVTVLRDEVTGLDPSAGRVKLNAGGWLDYDRLVLAAGVSFDKVPGWNPSKVPHAWIAGNQTRRLRDQLRAMPDGGTYVQTVPKAPFRCPPGPYERACLVADLLGQRGGGGAPKVILLDANPDIQADKATFTRAFNGIYRDIIEYHTNVDLLAVDSNKRIAETSTGSFQGDVLNIIPRHKAGKLVINAGLTGGGRWAGVDPTTYESRDPAFPGIHIIGDSQATSQPKSGHMANAQAKVCADAIVRLMGGQPVDSPERIANIVTNSACFSPITRDKAAWLTAVFAYDAAAGDMKLVKESLGEAPKWNRDSFKKMFAWSRNLFDDSFA